MRLAGQGVPAKFQERAVPRQFPRVARRAVDPGVADLVRDHRQAIVDGGQRAGKVVERARRDLRAWMGGAHAGKHRADAGCVLRAVVVTLLYDNDMALSFHLKLKKHQNFLLELLLLHNFFLLALLYPRYNI